MSNPIKQHYVPQVYLKHFALKRDKIWEVLVADKKHAKPYRANIRDVAFEKNFYTVERLGEQKYAWEEYYSQQVEPLIGETFQRLIQRCTCVFTRNQDVVIDENIRAALSVILITQHLRTPKARLHQYNTSKEIFPSVIVDIIKKLEPHIRLEQKRYLQGLSIDDIFKDIDMSIVIEPTRIKKFAQILYDKCWIVYRNDNYRDNPFATSDHPMVQYNMVSLETSLKSNGIGIPQTIIHYPINSQIILAIYDKQNLMFQFIEDMDGCIVFLNATNDNNYVTKMNLLQYEQCIQHVFFKPFE